MFFSAEQQSVRFLHTGDLHLDSPFSGLSAKKSEERRRELRETFSRITAFVRDRAVDLVLIAGDVFDCEYVTPSTARLLIDELAACTRAKFVISPGNHDPYTQDSLWASDRLPENVRVFSTEALGSFVFPELNTTVYGWAFLSDTLAASPLAGRRVDEPDRLNLICAHADFGVPLSKYAPMTAADLAAFGAQYAALGHKHIPTPPTPVGDRTLMAYCGCPEGRSFDEPGRGGFILCEATKKEGGWQITTERVEIARRRYESETVDLTGVDTAVEAARRIKAVVEQKGYGEDTALRITFTGATPPDFPVPKQADGTQLGLYSLELADRTSPVYDARYLENDLSVRGELYRSLLPQLTSGTPEERALAARALRIGIAALQGEDITNL